MYKSASLTPDIKAIMFDKATERPEHVCDLVVKPGSYLCRNCGIKLFSAENKFDSGTGWPSFDQQHQNHVLEIPDADCMRTEIICSKCEGHLGHVFYDEGFTKKDRRYCVNAKALDFTSNVEVTSTDEIILAAGCFWGVEYYFNKLPGVVQTEVGYIGGKSNRPTYKEVCYANSGHYEAVRVLFDDKKINVEQILKYFFEIHDFTQVDGQGGDIGTQYLSRIFCYDDEQKLIAEQVIQKLVNMNYFAATQILPMQIFWPGEDYHQQYYQNNGQSPYCHFWRKIFA